jgi:organic radical activating enzyme
MKKLKVNEIFYSLQGEGYHTGQAAIFVRFSGCNLKCPFCDTNFNGYIEMTEGELIDKIREYPAKFVVFTGGEPTFQVTKGLCKMLHSLGYYLAIETNGMMPTVFDMDWVTLSPKNLYVKGADPLIVQANELKIVMDDKVDPELFKYPNIKVDYKYIQPCDTGDKERNQKILQRCVDFIKENPDWTLSLQTQKILNIK